MVNTICYIPGNLQLIGRRISLFIQAKHTEKTYRKLIFNNQH